MSDYNDKRKRLAKAIKDLYSNPWLEIRIDFTAEKFGCKKITTENSPHEERLYSIPQWIIEGCSETEILRAATEIACDGYLSPQNRLLGEYDLHFVLKKINKELGLTLPAIIIEGKVAKCYLSCGSLFISRELIGRFSKANIALAILSTTHKTIRPPRLKYFKGRRPVLSIFLEGERCLVDKELFEKMVTAAKNKEITSALEKIDMKTDGVMGMFAP